MAPRTSTKKERKHVHLTEGRWDRLTELYKPQGLSPGSVIDRLVGHHLKKLDEAIAIKLGQARPSSELSDSPSLEDVTNG